jgi:hypothetical protein
MGWLCARFVRKRQQPLFDAAHQDLHAPAGKVNPSHAPCEERITRQNETFVLDVESQVSGRVAWCVERAQPEFSDLQHLPIAYVAVHSRDLAELQAHHHRLGWKVLQHGFGLRMHQDRAGVLVDEGGDGPDVVYVGVSDDYGPNLQSGLLDRERDAGRLVAGIYDRAHPRFLFPDDVAVLLERADREHLQDHRVLPSRNSISRRAGTPVAPFVV